jgi:2-aminoethylphosphonate dioxygenase
MQLTSEQLAFWNDNAYLLMPGLVPLRQREALLEWTQALQSWPETPGKWMKYFESSSHDRARLLCRVEDFVPYHSQFSEFLQDDLKLGILAKLMGEPAILYKEKINFKMPGGKGFTHHQDAPAFGTFGHTYHITMMVALDPSTIENGCLEVVRGWKGQKILPQAPDGTIRKDVIESLQWSPVTMEPGDVLFFDSFIPHGSAPNRSQAPRRALYVTYNRKSEGDYRAEYFAQKRLAFPPECERVPGRDYSQGAGVFNLGNPID